MCRNKALQENLNYRFVDIKEKIRQNRFFPLVRKNPLYKWRVKLVWHRHRKKLLMNEAKEAFAHTAPHGTFSDYRAALKKNLVSYSEYMHQYEFWHLNEDERSKYVSRLEMRFWYQEVVPEYIHQQFWNKAIWLETNRQYIQRKWYNLAEMPIEDIKSRLDESKYYILKPTEGCLGEGIRKIKGAEFGNSLFDSISSQDYILEECVVNIPEIAAFHPQSLNTIRVVTIGRNAEVLGAFLRVGRGGNVVDNAHAGGIFCTVDVETGRIISRGLDTDGNYYERHPDSDKEFMGFQIPRWIEIKALLKEMHSLTPDAPVVGWDVALTPDGIEVIEANHLPDMDVMQSPMKIGIRERLNGILSRAGLPRLR